MIAGAPRRSWVEQIMGLPISVLARGEGAASDEADGAVRRLFAELAEVDATFSPYRPDSVVSRLGRGEISLAQCPADVREVAARCEDARTLTGGLFDATTLSGQWDPSGLVKGWAVERAARRLPAGGSIDWCVNAGGDVIVMTTGGEPFVVGIQDPRDPGKVCASVAVSSGAVATSGSAARGVHIYDPRTRSAVESTWASVSVLGASLEIADVLATAAFVAGDGWADVVQAVEGYAGLAVTSAGELFRTREWPLAKP